MSIKGRCESCDWWKEWVFDADPDDWPALRDDGGSRISDGEFNDVPAPGRWGFCGKAAEFGPTLNDKFYVIDGSEYRASLHCRSDFGCVEWVAIAGADQKGRESDG